MKKTDIDLKGLLREIIREELAGDRASAKKAPSRSRGITPEMRAWAKQTKTCNNCKKVKPVLSLDTPRLPDFGVTCVRGVLRPNSWCRACRSQTSYYNAERKYKTRNS